MVLGLMTHVFTITNVVIILGYIFVAFAVVPYMEIRTWTKVWGAIFFFFCALTHMELALHAYTETGLGFDTRGIDFHMHFVHIVQAISVWGFVTGLYREFVIPRAVKDD